MENLHPHQVSLKQTRFAVSFAYFNLPPEVENDAEKTSAFFIVSKSNLYSYLSASRDTPLS